MCILISIKDSFNGDLMVIGVEFGREDHSLIPTTAIGRRLKPLDTIIDPEPD
jgi:hypothetical protein